MFLKDSFLGGISKFLYYQIILCKVIKLFLFVLSIMIDMHDINFDVGDDEVPNVNCENIPPEKLDQSLSNFNSSFSILNLNIRSCRKNFASLLPFLSMLVFKFTIIILTETWLTSNTDLGFDIDGYNQLNVYRNNHGGGIKIYYNNAWNAEVLTEFTTVNEILEILSLKLHIRNFKYIISAVYRRPSSDPFIFNDTFFDQILSSFNRNDKMFIAGDLNLDLYNHYNFSYINTFIDLFLSLSFFPLIKLPTRYNDNTGAVCKFTLLDHVWCNFLPDSDSKSGIITLPITDHFPVFYVFKQKSIDCFKIIKHRVFNEVNLNKFVISCNSTTFDDVFNSVDVNNAFNLFYNRLMNLYDKSFPIKQKIIRNKGIHAPWVNHKLKKCIQKKYKLFNLFKRGIISKHQFNVYKSLLRFVINKSRKQFYMKRFTDSRNTKETWKNINGILGRKKISSIIKLCEGDVQIQNRDLLNYINKYFVDVPKTLVSELPNAVNWDFFRSIPTNLSSFYFFHSTTDEVYKIIKALPNKGNKLNDLTPKMLLRVFNVVGHVISMLYNRCIDVGVYPNKLKIARVIPIHKGGLESSVTNYRPISNLTLINKIFEKLTFARIQDFITNFRILSDYQFGFRKNCSTGLAIFTLLNDLIKTFNKKLFTVAIFVDLKKAFDTVDRRILMHKLGLYGFRGHINDFLCSYLTDRKQYVDVNGLNSELMSVDFGVPQGSVLGPQLFNIFINDFTLINSAKKILFADDSIFYVTDPDFDTCIFKLNMVLNDINSWLHNNRLTPNLLKTKLMIFTPKVVDELPDIFLSNTKLEWIKTIKYLGVIIDNKLSFIPECNSINRKLSNIQGAIYSMSSYMPRLTLLTVYNSLAYSLLTYSIIFWGGIALYK